MPTRYTYKVLILGQAFECASVREVVNRCNEVLGAPTLTSDTLLNYFSRPHVVSKRVLGTLVKVSRQTAQADRQLEGLM